METNKEKYICLNCEFVCYYEKANILNHEHGLETLLCPQCNKKLERLI